MLHCSANFGAAQNDVCDLLCHRTAHYSRDGVLPWEADSFESATKETRSLRGEF